MDAVASPVQTDIQPGKRRWALLESNSPRNTRGYSRHCRRWTASPASLCAGAAAKKSAYAAFSPNVSFNAWFSARRRVSAVCGPARPR